MKVYLDANATTQVDPEVLTAMLPYYSERFGNPSNLNWHGRQSRKAVERARQEVAGLINANAEEIIFTAGATEANNLAIRGCVSKSSEPRKIVTQATEHASVLEVCRDLERQGVEVIYLTVDAQGLVTPDQIKEAITDGASLVSIMWANNEIGTIQNLAEIGDICRAHNVLFHTDATQAIGRLPVNVKSLGVDFLSLSAHKTYGPMGIGALFVRGNLKHSRLTPQTFGGGQEEGLRSGTPNVPGIIGFGAACSIAASSQSSDAEHVRGLTEQLLTGLHKIQAGLKIIGPQDHRLPGNLSCLFPGIDAKSLMNALHDVSVSTGSACASHSFEPSHVLKAIGLDERQASSVLRFGISRFNTTEEIAYAIRRVGEELATLKALTPELVSNPHPQPELSTDKGYDQLAATYANLWFNDEVMRPLAERFCRELESGAAILDAGCGPGRDVAFFRSAGFDVVGVDRSNNMITEARARVQQAIFRKMDFTKLAFPLETFDGIWACASLIHLPRQRMEAALRELSRVLTLGGKLFTSLIQGKGEDVDQHGRHYTYYSESEIEHLLNAAGFRIIDRGSSSSNKSTSNRRKPKVWMWLLAEKIDTTWEGRRERECIFCPDHRLKSSRRLGLATASSIVWGNDHHYVVPDVAPLMDGHLLLVSNQHHLSLGALNDSDLKRVEATKRKISALFKQIYGTGTLFFEHGSSEDMDAGSCIDHAHCHCLPSNLDLYRTLQSYSLGKDLKRFSVELRREFSEQGKPYLYLEQNENEAWIVDVSAVPSQFFRRVITTASGRRLWRWNEASQEAWEQEAYAETITKMARGFDELMDN